MQQPSLPLKVMCHQRSSAIKMTPPPSAHLPPLTSSVLFGKAPKNNHPGHAPLLPIISLIYPHLTLRVSFLLAVFLPFRLPLIVIVFFCPCHCFAFFHVLLCSFFLVPSTLLLSLPLSHYCSSLSSAHFLVSLTASYTPRGKKPFSLNSQPNLHYPTPSFYPLITHSTLLA